MPWFPHDNPFYSNISLKGNHLKSIILEYATTGNVPNGIYTSSGRIIYDTGTQTPYFHNGSEWISMSSEDATASFPNLQGGFNNTDVFYVGSGLLPSGQGFVDANRFFGSGEIPIPKGGTGATGFVEGGLAYGNSVSGLQSTNVLMYLDGTLMSGPFVPSLFGNSYIRAGASTTGVAGLMMTPGLLTSGGTSFAGALEYTVSGFSYIYLNGARRFLTYQGQEISGLFSGILPVFQGGTNATGYEADLSLVQVSGDTLVSLEPGTSGYFLATNGAYGVAWVSGSAGAGGGATVALDNLSAVAINTSLVSDSDLADDLGSSFTRWKFLYVSGINTGTDANDTVVFQAWDTDASAYHIFGTLTAGTVPTFNLGTGVTIGGNDIAFFGGAFHDSFSDFISNEHINHTGVVLTAGTGLIGGGDISTSRVFNVDITELIEDVTPTGLDYVLTYDASASQHKKALISNLPSAGGSTTLAELTDTDVVFAASGEALAFNGIDWINTTVAGVGGGSSFKGFSVKFDGFTQQTFSNNVQTAVTGFDIIEYDTENWFATGTFQPAESGKYVLNGFARLGIGTSVDDYEVSIYKNHQHYAYLGVQTFANNLYYGLGGSVLVDSASGDRWNLYVFASQGTGGSHLIGDQSGGDATGYAYFQGYKIEMGGAGGSSTYADLTDTNMGSVASGNIAQYDGTSWQPVTPNPYGTAFPTPSVTGQTFLRTDLNKTFFWNGTYWLGELKSFGGGVAGSASSSVFMRMSEGNVLPVTAGGDIGFPINQDVLLVEMTSRNKVLWSGTIVCMTDSTDTNKITHIYNGSQLIINSNLAIVISSPEYLKFKVTPTSGNRSDCTANVWYREIGN